MKILMLKSSGNKSGSSSLLAEAFARGAKENGHEITEFDVLRADIRPCLGCNRCGMNGPCVQKDDYEMKLKGMIKKADMLVFVMPVYYYNWPAQLKTVIDRTYAMLSTMRNKTFYMISTCMSPDETWCKVMLDSFRTYLECYDETVVEGGYVFGFGTGAPGDVKKTDAMQKAYEMGKNLGKN